MKTLLAALALAICLTLPIHADEWLLGGAGTPSAAATGTGPDAPAKDAADTRVHLGLDRHEQNDTPVAELPAIRMTSSVSETTATTAVSPNWNKPDAVQALTPGVSAAPVQSMTTLAPALPASNAPPARGADLWLYVGVATLLLALAWVCVASVRQGNGATAGATKPWSPGGEVVRESRRSRVKMVALKVKSTP